MTASGRQHRDRPDIRGVLTGLGLTVALALLCGSRPRQLSRPGDFLGSLAVADPRDSLPTVLAVLAWLLGCWLVGGALVSLLARAPGPLGRWCAGIAARVTPRAVRRLVDVAVGVTVAVGTVGGIPAYGAPPPSAPTSPAVPSLDRPGAAAVVPSLDRPGPVPAARTTSHPGPAADGVPARPALRAPGALQDHVRARHPDIHQVVVAPGDSLWRIAARHLPAGATSAEIAEAWPHWYATNRAAIGPDPDLIRPGQRLAVPRD